MLGIALIPDPYPISKKSILLEIKANSSTACVSPVKSA